MIKQFKDIADDMVFKIADKEFKKIPSVKVSCCKSINAVETSNATNRIFVQPLQEVEVND